MDTTEIQNLIESGNDEFEAMLIIACVWNEKTFRQLRAIIGTDKLNDLFGNPMCGAIYRAIESINGIQIDSGQVFLQSQMIPMELMNERLNIFANQGDHLSPGEITLAIQTYYTAWQKHCSVHAMQIVEAGYKSWFRHRRRQAICRAALLRNTVDVGKELSDLERAVRAADGDNQMLSLQQIASMPEKKAARIPTGFTPLDRKLGGGFAKGEGTLILGPTGCGKSVCSSQFSVDMSSPVMGCKGLLIATEMEPEDFHRPIISNKLKISYSWIKDGIPEGMLNNRDVRQRYDILMESLGKTWRIFRWRDHKGTGIFSAMDDLIKRAQDEMGGLDHVHLDWLGGALGRDAYGAGREPRLVWQEAADSSARLAGQHNLSMVVYAQAHPQNALDRRRVGAEMAAECKSLHREMTTAIGISAILADGSEERSANGSEETTYKDVQHFFISKSRKSAGGTVPFRRKFDQMRIDPVSY